LPKKSSYEIRSGKGTSVVEFAHAAVARHRRRALRGVGHLRPGTRRGRRPGNAVCKAEDLIRYTDDVKGLSALIAQGVDVKRPGKNSQGRTFAGAAAMNRRRALGVAM
jgi:hypothetical protein